MKKTKSKGNIGIARYDADKIETKIKYIDTKIEYLTRKNESFLSGFNTEYWDIRFLLLNYKTELYKQLNDLKNRYNAL